MKKAISVWRTLLVLAAFWSLVPSSLLKAQCSPTAVYGVTLSGVIYPIDLTATTATLGSALSTAAPTIKNPNGMGYNAANGKFYLFTQDASSTQNQFSS